MSYSALNCVTHETTPAKGLVCFFFTFLQSETRGQQIEPFVFVLIGGFKVMCWSYTQFGRPPSACCCSFLSPGGSVKNLWNTWSTDYS